MTFMGYDAAGFLEGTDWRSVTVCLWTGLWVWQLNFADRRQPLTRSELSAALGPPDEVVEGEEHGLDHFRASLGLQPYTIDGVWDRSGSIVGLAVIHEEGPEKMAEHIAAARALRRRDAGEQT